jgi:hypothetical protein
MAKKTHKPSTPKVNRPTELSWTFSDLAPRNRDPVQVQPGGIRGPGLYYFTNLEPGTSTETASGQERGPKTSSFLVWD